MKWRKHDQHNVTLTHYITSFMHDFFGGKLIY